jgi:hypothetical protein
MTREFVSPEDRLAVLERDQRCFGTRLNRAHVCRDQWGNPHHADDWLKLTMDHVHCVASGACPHLDQPSRWARHRTRALSDPRHMVAMCHALNVGAPSKEIREAERQYLDAVTYAAARAAGLGPKEGPVSWPDGIDPSEVPELVLLASYGKAGHL